MISSRRSKVKLKSIKQQSIVRELQIVWHYWILRYGIEREGGGHLQKLGEAWSHAGVFEFLLKVSRNH